MVSVLSLITEFYSDKNESSIWTHNLTIVGQTARPPQLAFALAATVRL